MIDEFADIDVRRFVEEKFLFHILERVFVELGRRLDDAIFQLKFHIKLFEIVQTLTEFYQTQPVRVVAEIYELVYFKVGLFV